MKFSSIKIGLILSALLLSPSVSAETLKLWEHEREEIQKVLDVLIKKFEAKNKDIKVKRSHFKTEDLRTQFQTAALARGGADVVIAPNDFAGPLSVMGVIKPVQSFAKSDRFFPEIVEAVTDANGTMWGLPISRGNHLMLFANKKFVKKAPETLEELVKIAKKITTKKGSKKKVYGFAYNLNEPFWFVTFMSAYGQRPLLKAKPNLSHSAMVDALSFVHDLKYKDKVVPQDCDYACADTLFIESKAAMIINGDWAVNKYNDALKDNLLIAPLPKSEKTGKYMEPMVSGKYVFFNNKLKSKKFAAAKKFAEYLASTEAQVYFAEHGGRLPALKSVGDSPVIKKSNILSASSRALAHGQPMPMEVEMRAVWDAMRPQLQSVMANRTKPKLAAAVMQKDAETKIKEMKQ